MSCSSEVISLLLVHTFWKFGQHSRGMGQETSQSSKNSLIAPSDSASVNDGAWPTPGTSTTFARLCTRHILLAVALARISLSAPRTIKSGHAIRAYGTHKSNRCCAVPPRSGRRTLGSIFHTSPPSAAALTDHFTCSATTASDSFAIAG